VSISFADGTTASANLVIACDGIHSTIRSQFAVDKPVYSGRIAYRGLVPMSAIASEWPYSTWTLSWLAPNKHFLVFPISKNKQLNVVAFMAKDEENLGGLKESWKASSPRARLEREYEGWTHTVQKIMQAMPPVISEWKINDRDPLSQWHYMDGKVVLSGDAAHAMVPQQGMFAPIFDFVDAGPCIGFFVPSHILICLCTEGSGAGLSIEDANVLGLAVRDYLANPSAGLSAYMSLYQDTRLPRAQKAQATSRQAAEVYDMKGPDFEGLSFEECLPVVKEKVTSRMAWVWNTDLEADYAAAKEKSSLP
jgi:salicylate hydroxylase